MGVEVGVCTWWYENPFWRQNESGSVRATGLSHPPARMPESQHHGLLWETDIKTKVFNLEAAAASYTAIHDVDRSQNRLNAN